MIFSHLNYSFQKEYYVMGKCSQYIKWKGGREGTTSMTSSQSYLRVCTKEKEQEKKIYQKQCMILWGMRLSMIFFFTILCTLSEFYDVHTILNT